MVLPALALGDLGLLAVYAAVLGVPGGAVALAGGLRGWTAVAVAPLLTCGLVGLAGPASSGLGLRWSVWILLGAAAVVAVVVAVGVRVLGAPRSTPPPWDRAGHVAVAACVLAAAATGLVVVVVGMGGLRTIPQDWDAALHANGIRWIAENGDAGLTAMTRVNWYERADGLFYPNAYHLVATVVYEITGRDIPSVLNAGTVLTLAVLALGVAAMVRRWGGRAVHAGASALTVVAVTAFYDMLSRGPLLPYALAVALLPAGLILVMDFLDARDVRAGVVAGALFAVGLGGLLSVHPGVAVSLVLLGATVAGWRWWHRPATAVREAALLAAAGLAAGVLYAAQLLGSARSAAGPSVDWPADLSVSDALGQVVLFNHHAAFPQWWLVLALAAGLVGYRRLGPLSWLGPAAAVFGALFVVAAAYDTPWAEAVTRPWWNDRYRLIGIAGVLVAILAGHGLAEVQRVLARPLTAAVERWRGRPAAWARPLPAALLGAAVLAAFVVASHGLYLARNEAVMRTNTGEGPAVSSGEVAGYAALARMVAPGDRVMNDRGDGSVWMYALDGVHPVAAHYDPTDVGPDAALLSDRFDRYDTDPAVRAAAARLHVRWVVVGEGFLRYDAQRVPGLVGLDQVASLRLAWADPVFRIYEILPP